MVFKPSAKTQLKKAHDAQAAIVAQIADKEAARNAALLAGAEAAAVAKIDDEIAALHHAERTEADRIKLLEQEAEREEGLARAKRRAELIGRVKARIAERDQAGAELEKKLGEAVKLFRRAHEIGLEAAAMWSWNESDRIAIGLSGMELKLMVMHHIFKVGSVVNPLGGLPFHHMAPSFPGGQNPKPTEWAMRPDKVPSLTEALALRSKFATRVLDGGTIGKAVRTAAPDPIGAAPERTAAEARLSDLLNRQAALANDLTPRGEQKYKAVVREIASLSAEIKAVSKPAAPEPRPAA
jgi:hypothetical protein